MRSRQKASLADLLAKQAPAPHGSSEAKPLETPFFDEFMERADKTSIANFEALLTEITGAVDPAKIPQFPTGECLSPEDVYKLENLGQRKQAHLSSCPWCK